MLLSTLADVPGHQFHVRGFVYAEGFHGIGGGKAPGMIQSLIQQATQLGGNGIIDITVVRTGEHAWIMTGTAIALA